MSTYTIPVGPLHVALEEPMYFRIEVDGEKVVSVDITAGHVHRGIEYLATKRNIYQNIVLTERVCSLCSNSHPQTYCMALESITGMVVPPRAQYLRVIADETKRVASHMFNVAILAHIVGFDSLFMHVMEAREIMQDTKEAVFGNRMDIAAMAIGGVKYDLDKDGRDYFIGQLDKLEPTLRDEIIPLYQTNPSIVDRTRGIGVLSAADCVDYGLMGPVARGSGHAYDVRKQAPYAVYDRLDFEMALGEHGDVWSRAMVRWQEALTSIGLIRQCLRDMPDGPTKAGPVPPIPAGEAVAKTEAPRGELIYYLKTNGTDRPERLKWRVPTYMNWDALNVMMAGARISDIPLIVNSIDPCISCTER
ncbi:hydrogenase large subunit [Rhodospirillum rubrum]|uniref:Carbon monoxide-induced hydrogenase n=2 Tax=Rhodospirillum rubrum TaxID=1085 RepID=COOH_RHORU|nr:nickel-dependent hydrogenase large subunit [Rhodospirillum rubrum]P31895.2 RecName: Full=Carbon monoxide-induced hydrogenase [Rhodospirillum rubrum]AAC45121.1 CooH [Rhodospirillum rubrum]ABC22226.1 ech hydrogenase subunit E [Rhodospirillum rubrum ATCC 11170]AEO47942.1 ech hydrogenase subunit E [Rhodospirillum rubrum F11]MBK5952860.1 carbon monoxide-induced hydrogenase [Rhodospirillum rubrum]QXG81870.1 carbon monoxide-induced hydrogenase [Rhodospirillum rubrum]